MNRVELAALNGSVTAQRTNKVYSEVKSIPTCEAMKPSNLTQSDSKKRYDARVELFNDRDKQS